MVLMFHSKVDAWTLNWYDWLSKRLTYWGSFVYYVVIKRKIRKLTLGIQLEWPSD
jgi:hypothetical protein